MSVMDHFKLSAIDPELGCPILQALIPGPDINSIRTLIGLDSHDDPDGYIINPDEARAVAEQFGIAFAPITPDTLISRVSFDLDEPLQTAPYLNHTGIELFFMLDGAKPLSIFSFEYPVYDDDGKTEDLFEPHVHAGKIVKRVVTEAFERPVRGFQGRRYEGLRHLYYALPGQEWRIDAFLLLWKQNGVGAWNEAMERMMGSLLGYTDAQNDWWIAHLRHEGNFPWGLTTVYVSVSADVLDWTRSTGFRALPWNGLQTEFLLEQRWKRPDILVLNAWMERDGAAAVIRLGLQQDFLKDQPAEGENGSLSYRISNHAIPALNQALRRGIEVICERSSMP